MKSILSSLYYGDIIPRERPNSIREQEQLREMIRKIEGEERYFMAKMLPEDCKRFEDLSRLYMELSNAEEENLFSYAFTLGMLLTMDVMKEAEVKFNG